MNAFIGRLTWSLVERSALAVVDAEAMRDSVASTVAVTDVLARKSSEYMLLAINQHNNNEHVYSPKAADNNSRKDRCIHREENTNYQ